MSNLKPGAASRAAGFTLVELLVVITIIAILAGMALMALAGATEQARIDRTNAEITKLHELVMERYEGYRVRPLPMRIAAGIIPVAGPGLFTPGPFPNGATSAAQIRMWGTWELMRMELPERKSDVINPAGFLKNSNGSAMQPSLWLGYQRRALAQCGTNWQDDTAGWTPAYQGAECLYMIIASLRDGETTGLDSFTAREIGDLDGDNMPEILDAWGNPIEFLRWAPGFFSEMQECNPSTQPDPFDPYKLYPMHFALVPLIYSPGQDRKYDLNSGGGVNYATLGNDPYYSITSGDPIGKPMDANGDGYESHADNMHNHINQVR